MSAVRCPIWILVTALILGDSSHYIAYHIHDIYVKIYTRTGYICKLGSVGRPGGGFVVFPNKRKPLFVGPILVHDVNHRSAAAIGCECDLPALWIKGWGRIDGSVKSDLAQSGAIRVDDV